MNNKYFDKWDFHKALDFADINPLEAKARFEEYFKRYPNDYSSYSYYTYILIMLGKFDEAEKILDSVENRANGDINFNKDANKVKVLRQNFVFSRMKILAYQEKFEELEKLYFENLSLLESYNLKAMMFYCRRRLGKYVPNQRDTNAYLFRQIVEYKQSDFIKHIQKHLADYNANLEDKNSNIFAPSFPVQKVIDEMVKYIPSSKALYPGFYEDIYIFKYDACGRQNNKIVDYFKVICFHNTKNFITMLPCDQCKDLPNVDLNYLMYNEQNVKTKKLSQIEKFNKKYGKN